MAEIRTLSMAHLEPRQVDRLSAALAEAHAAGVDLGPRAPHIRISAQALIDLNSKLQEGAAHLAATLSTLGIKDPAAIALLKHLDEMSWTLSQSTTNLLLPTNDEA